MAVFGISGSLDFSAWTRSSVGLISLTNALNLTATGFSFSFYFLFLFFFEVAATLELSETLG